MTIAIVAGFFIFCCILGGAANRFWGWDQGIKPLAAILFGIAVSLFIAVTGFPVFIGLLALPCTAAGFYLGRITDGVRGTFLQKSLRGWKYGLIYIALTIITKSLWMMSPMLFFWQSGAIHWAIATKAAGKWDYVPMAERTDGAVRIAFLMIALLCHGFSL